MSKAQVEACTEVPTDLSFRSVRDSSSEAKNATAGKEPAAYQLPTADSETANRLRRRDAKPTDLAEEEEVAGLPKETP